MIDLEVAKTHSRPTSRIQSVLRGQFKTVKYRPDFPDRFGPIEDARAHCQQFFHWYNHEHRHGGSAMAASGEQRSEMDRQGIRAECFERNEPACRRKCHKRSSGRICRAGSQNPLLGRRAETKARQVFAIKSHHIVDAEGEIGEQPVLVSIEVEAVISVTLARR